ncbi:MAG TPA: pilus assembly protein PilP [Acidiferrobacterales bacterium]|nr:pilus assembly protein PilP [Acidiferrobacterales bacterium]
MRRALSPFVLAIGLLTGCSSDGLDDLRDFIKTAHADRKPKIEPLPEIKPYEAFAYAASDLTNPFSPANLRPQSVQAKLNGPRPDMNRRKEPLEDYPLDSLKMVGTLSKGKQSWGIIQTTDGAVYRVQKGNHLGQNFGRITRVTDEKIDLIELIQGAMGEWVEREASIAIQE